MCKKVDNNQSRCSLLWMYLTRMPLKSIIKINSMNMMEHVIKGYNFFYPCFWLKIAAILLYIETFVTYMNISINSLNDLLNIQLIHLLLAIMGVLIIIIGSFFIHILLIFMWASFLKYNKSNTLKEYRDCSVSLETLRSFAIIENNIIANNLYQKEVEKENLLLVTYGISSLIAVNLIIGGKLHQLCCNEITKGWSITFLVLFFIYTIFFSCQYNWNGQEVFVGKKVTEKIKEVIHYSVIGDNNSSSR